MKVTLVTSTLKDLTTVNVDLKDKKLTFDVAKLLQADFDFRSCNEYIAQHGLLVAAAGTLTFESIQIEAEIGLEKAKLDGTIRKGWDAERDGKMTEDGIKSRVKSSPSVAKLEEDLLDARKGAAVLQSLVSLSNTKYSVVITYLYNNPTKP